MIYQKISFKPLADGPAEIFSKCLQRNSHIIIQKEKQISAVDIPVTIKDIPADPFLVKYNGFNNDDRPELFAIAGL